LHALRPITSTLPTVQASQKRQRLQRLTGGLRDGRCAKPQDGAVLYFSRPHKNRSNSERDIPISRHGQAIEDRKREVDIEIRQEQLCNQTAFERKVDGVERVGNRVRALSDLENTTMMRMYAGHELRSSTAVRSAFNTSCDLGSINLPIPSPLLTDGAPD
jgi:hypothetical protein